MEVVLNWKQGLTFSGVGAQGVEMPIDVGEDHGGSGSGASPMELTLMALCGCSGMDAISIMGKKKQNVTGFEIKAKGERSENHPKVFTKIHVDYTFKGADLDPAAAERSVELSLTRYCSVYGMLIKAVPITAAVHVVQE